MTLDVDEISCTPPLLHCSAVTQQTVELGHFQPLRAVAGAAERPPGADTLRAVARRHTPTASTWRAEWTCSARLASNVGLLGDRQSVINLDTEIANRALDLGMPEQQLYGPQIARSAIN